MIFFNAERGGYEKSGAVITEEICEGQGAGRRAYADGNLQNWGAYIYRRE
jgi:hypothetical protein